MKKILLPLLAGLSTFTGCNTPPPRTDPFEGIQAAGSSRYNNLSVAIMPSQNTEKAMAYLRSRIGGMGNMDSGPIYQEITDAIQATFGRVVKVASLQDVPGSQSDLAALVDIYPQKGEFAAQMDAKVILLTPDGRQIDEFNGHGEQRIAFTLLPHMTETMAGAAHKAAAQLKSAFLASTALAEFAKSKAVPIPGVAAGGSAPAPMSAIHSDVDRPTYGGQERPDHFALVIGVEKYSALPEAQFAERDAAAVKRHLLALGYPERNILYLTGQQASRAALAKNLESWLPRNVDENGTVFFYYSGHGAPDVKTGEAYLLPWDADAQSLEFTAYPIKRLYEKLNALKAGKIIVALDSCFSGAGGRSVLAQGARPLVTKIDTGSAAAGKLVVFTAAAADEITGTVQEEGHGLFTYNFLKGLNANNGSVTVKNLYGYLLPKVQDAARRNNRDQTPQLIPPDLKGRASLGLR